MASQELLDSGEGQKSLPYRFAREKRVIAVPKENKVIVTAAKSVSLETITEIRSFFNKPLEINWLSAEDFEKKLSDQIPIQVHPLSWLKV